MQLPDQFILYRKRFDSARQKWQKFPVARTQNGWEAVDAHDPVFWMDRATAEASRHHADGIAFVISENDPWFFIDLDNCLNADSTWKPEAEAIFLSFAGAYGEVSLSGTGLHILGQCDKSKLQDRRNKWDGWAEFYIKERFVALSDNGLSVIGGGEFSHVNWTNQLLHTVPQREHLGELPSGVDERYTGPQGDDELLEMALASEGGAGAAFGAKATFAQLWTADKEVLGKIYPAYDGHGDFDHSSADAALMAHLAFWTGRDMPRMDRMFRRSALMRDKYDKRTDYRTETIQKAARLCKNVYDFQKPEKKDITLSEQYLSAPEQLQHFEGCVYVRDEHRVLVPDGALLRAEQFNATYGGHIFQVMPDSTRPTKKAFEAFTENACQEFPKARCAEYRPGDPFGEIKDNKVNAYVDPQVPSQPGDVTRFLALLAAQHPDERDRTIILSWMAALIQNPGIKIRWAWVNQGVEGNGKSFFGEVLKYCVGENYWHEPRASQLGEKFNQFIVGKRLIYCDEIHMRDRMEILDDLKTQITSTHIEIRGMQKDKYMAQNFANFYMCTNYRDAVIKSKNDRRYFITFAAQQEHEDLALHGLTEDWFTDLFNWADNGGYANILHFLENFQIPDEFNAAKTCQRAPESSSTERAIELSRPMTEATVIDAIEAGVQGFRDGWISSHAVKELWIEENVRFGPRTMQQTLEKLGFIKWGRSARVIMAEGGTKPTIYCRTDLKNEPVEQFLSAQGYHG